MPSYNITVNQIAGLALALTLVGCKSSAQAPNGNGGSANGGSVAGGSNATGGGASGSAGGAGGSAGGAGGAGGSKGGAGGSTGGSAGGAGGASGGTCDNVSCTGGLVCVSGTCQCPTGAKLCGGVCLTGTDILTNPAHCGKSGCGTSCPDTATCSSGVCQCPNGQTACGVVCSDLNTDPKNCGKCGTTCASGICTAGVCQKVKDCATKTIMVTPLVADFESYDGTTAATSWGWAINAPAGAANAVYAGLFDSNDGTGTPLLSIQGPGYSSSKYAASISNTQATKWGGQLGMWMGCVDASAYAGLSFWVKGSVPSSTATLALATAGTSAPDTTGFGGGTCTTGTCSSPSITFSVTSDWSQVLIPWATFTPGTANGGNVTTTGSDITGMSWNAALAYGAIGDGGYAPISGAYSLAVDNVQFMSNTACGAGLTVCGTGCVDTATNNANCSTCGNVCDSPRTCGSGKCNCPSGYTDCNGQCVNTQIDAQNCGGCGKGCSGVCSAGACQASTCTADMPQQGKTSTSGASIVLGKYWINNNLWGASGATGTQSIWSTCSSGNTIGWGTDWTWSGAAGQVKSYASAVLGWHWGTKVSGTGLPVQLSANKNITCGWTYRVQPGQNIDVSYDLFAHSLANPATNDDPTDEIMIWLYRSGGAAPIGGTLATVSIAGTSWELHQGMNNKWNVYSYVRATNADTGATLNLGDFLHDLTANRNMASAKYLSSIQAGTEVFLGSGRLDTDQYYCTIQ
jgi:hypothetical protein